MFVCYDLRFADEFWTLAPGSDAYFVVANWPAKRRLHWSALLRARPLPGRLLPYLGAQTIGKVLTAVDTLEEMRMPA